jgi:protein involved in polysaccharide export with SLBB domain
MSARLINCPALSGKRDHPARRLKYIGGLSAMLCTLALAGCAANSSNGEANRTAFAPPVLTPEQCAAGAMIQAASETDSTYLIQPGDQLGIEFYLNPDFNDDVVVRPDGKITLRLVGDTPAAGLTPTRLSQELDKDYLHELREPNAAVHVKNMPSRQIYVEGEVTKPGAVTLDAGMTALQAISSTGGLTPESGDTAVLIRRDFCGSPQRTDIDLKAAMKSPAQGEDLALLPRDILVIPRSGIANVDLWVDQYIRKLIPVNPYLPIPM